MASVTVEVDTDEFDDIELIQELCARGFFVSVPQKIKNKMSDWDRTKLDKITGVLTDASPEPREILREILDAIREGRTRDAVATLERAMFPKFRDLADCAEKYKSARAA